MTSAMSNTEAPMSEIDEKMMEAAVEPIKNLLRIAGRDGVLPAAQRVTEFTRYALTAALSLSRPEVERRPVAFRVRTPEGLWEIYQDERVCQRIAMDHGIEYQGLYVRDGSTFPDATAIREECARVAESVSWDQWEYVNGHAPSIIAARIRSLNHAGEAPGPKEDEK